MVQNTDNLSVNAIDADEESFNEKQRLVDRDNEHQGMCCNRAKITSHLWECWTYIYSFI